MCVCQGGGRAVHGPSLCVRGGGRGARPLFVCLNAGALMGGVWGPGIAHDRV